MVMCSIYCVYTHAGDLLLSIYSTYQRWCNEPSCALFELKPHAVIDIQLRPCVEVDGSAGLMCTWHTNEHRQSSL